MKTTKSHKLLLLLPFFLSLPSLASDSLKVKKTEYCEDGKLVRVIYLNRKGEKMKEYFYDYNEKFDENSKNLVFVFKFKDGKHYSITDYYIKIEANNLLFYNSPFIGSIQSIDRDSTGHFTESNAVLLKSYTSRISSLDSLELIPIIYENGFKKKYFYDKFGNIEEIKSVDKYNRGKRTLFQHDSLHRQTGYKYINKPFINFGFIKYFENYTETSEEKFLNKSLIEKTIEKVIFNNKKQELRIETYQIILKISKPIGEPKLTFTQENIYVNDRVVKIIYTDHILNKTKIHELKYEFY